MLILGRSGNHSILHETSGRTFQGNREPFKPTFWISARVLSLLESNWNWFFPSYLVKRFLHKLTLSDNSGHSFYYLRTGNEIHKGKRISVAQRLHKKISVNVYKGDYNTANTLAKQIFTECPTSIHSFSSSFITSTAKCIYPFFSSKPVCVSLSSVKFFNSHVRVPSTSGPTLMDTQFGSKKHFTRQLPSFRTISVLITWPGRTLSFIGSLKMMTRLYSVTKTARNNECEKNL